MDSTSLLIVCGSFVTLALGIIALLGGREGGRNPRARRVKATAKLLKLGEIGVEASIDNRLKNSERGEDIPPASTTTPTESA